jgi:hypothetical protein
LVAAAALSAVLKASATRIKTADVNSAVHFGPGCTLRVMMKTGADAASDHVVGARLVATNAFSAIVFVPKAVALKVMKREEGPALLRHLPRNPFPDSFNATPVSGGTGAELAPLIRRWPSVARVIEVRCPTLSA